MESHNHENSEENAINMEALAEDIRELVEVHDLCNHCTAIVLSDLALQEILMMRLEITPEELQWLGDEQTASGNRRSHLGCSNGCD
jgi:hypothetical protein